MATKKQAKDVVAEKVAAVGMPYVTERWAGGMLTNFPRYERPSRKMATIDKMTNDGIVRYPSKREAPDRAPARQARKEPGSIADLDASARSAVRCGRAEGGQRREGGQAFEHPRVCNGRYLL